jgi:hypothetical protein
MHRTTAALALTVLLASGAVACGSEDTTTDATGSGSRGSAKTSAASDPAGPAQSSRPTRPSSYPSPDAAQTRRLIDALRAVDPGLVVKESRAVDRARNTCRNIEDGEDAAKVRTMAELRFEGGNVPDLSPDQAARIVTAVEETFCH